MLLFRKPNRSGPLKLTTSLFFLFSSYCSFTPSTPSCESPLDCILDWRAFPSKPDFTFTFTFTSPHTLARTHARTHTYTHLSRHSSTPHRSTRTRPLSSFPIWHLHPATLTFLNRGYITTPHRRIDDLPCLTCIDRLATGDPPPVHETY